LCFTQADKLFLLNFEILKKFNRILGGKYQLDKDDNLNFHPEKSKVKLEIGESRYA
jgi:hypothetical protein